MRLHLQTPLMPGNLPRILRWLRIAVPLFLSVGARAADELPEIAISVAEQRLVILRDGKWLGKYKVSTSKFGIGDRQGSYKTPVGKLRVSEKIGGSLKSGSVIKHRNATGEILPVNSPGRDPIVTRIIWLEGLEEQNKNAKGRGIYIHGTVEEARIGQPVSYGCVRMRSSEVIEVFDQAPVGTLVTIQSGKLPRYRRWTAPPPATPAPAIVAVKRGLPAERKPEPEVSAKPAAMAAGSPATPAPPTIARTKKAKAAAAAAPSVAAAGSRKTEASPAAAAIADAAPKHPGDFGAAEAMKGRILFSGIPGSGPPSLGKEKEPAAADDGAASPPLPTVTTKEAAKPPAIQFRKAPVLRRLEPAER